MSRRPLTLAVSIAGLLVGCLEGCVESKQPSSRQASGRPAEAPAGAVRFLALGDSFTIGGGTAETNAFPARLADRWRTQRPSCALTLQNVAVNGFTTDDLITNELPAVASFKPTFVTVAIGANDIVQGISLDVYRQNVRRILETAKASGARVVVLPQPDWPKSPTGASFGGAAALHDQRKSFNAVLAEEARAKGAEWVDLVPLMDDQATKGLLAPDKLHPSREAYDAWAAEMARVINSPCSSGSSSG